MVLKIEFRQLISNKHDFDIKYEINPLLQRVANDR